VKNLLPKTQSKLFLQVNSKT